MPSLCVCVQPFLYLPHLQVEAPAFRRRGGATKLEDTQFTCTSQSQRVSAGEGQKCGWDDVM